MFGVELGGSMTRQSVNIAGLGLLMLHKCWVPEDLLTVAFKCQKTDFEVILKGLWVHGTVKRIVCGAAACTHLRPICTWTSELCNGWHRRVTNVSGILLLENINSSCSAPLLLWRSGKLIFSCPKFNVLFCFSCYKAGIINKSKWDAVGCGRSGGPLVWMSKQEEQNIGSGEKMSFLCSGGGRLK